MVWMRSRCATSFRSGRFFNTLSRISAAALMVKVMATISSGFSTKGSNWVKRRTRSSVLPEPAGAWTMNERRGSSAAASAIVFVAEDIRFLVDAAQRVQLAQAAGLQAFLRVDWGFAGSKGLAERVGIALPLGKQCGPRFGRVHLRQDIRTARVAHEAHLAGAHAGEHHRGEV